MEFVQFALLGLAAGAIYGLLSQGLVLIYRGSGILNFAQGAMAMFGAYAYFDFTERHGWATVPALIASLILCGLLGALIQLAVLRPMRKSSALSRVIATLGIVLILQSAAYLRYGHNTLTVPSLFPVKAIQIFSKNLTIGQDRIYILLICLALSGVLFAVYRYTSFGRVTTAVAEHEIAAASLGTLAKCDRHDQLGDRIDACRPRRCSYCAHNPPFTDIHGLAGSSTMAAR